VNGTVQLVDLSVSIIDGPSEATPVEITTLDHESAPAVFGLKTEDFPDGMAISSETVTLTTHTGTHMDAPLHYGPRTGNSPARSIDQVPLEWCFGPGFRLDLRHIPPGEGITDRDIADAVARMPHDIQPGNIALIWTGADRLWGTETYLNNFPGMTRAATAWLVERGVRVIGIDAWGFDRPFPRMLEDYRRTGDQKVLWPAHLYGREREYLQLEKLTRLDMLPAAQGFTIACFPISIRGLGASWTRVVAIVPDE
jgi:kynurenine formamidase